MRVTDATRSTFARARVLAVAAVLAACAPLPRARRSIDEPPSARELDAAARVRTRHCARAWGLLFPGVGQACYRRPTEAAVLASLGAAELATGIVVATRQPEGVEHPGAAVPLLALQDLWIISYVDVVLDDHRAARVRYAPQDTLGELVIAPFNGRVLARADVWAGILGTVTLGVGASLLLAGDLDTSGVGEDPNLFGRRIDAPLGYPLASAVGAGLFTHVAVAEELLFRGVVQSGIARGQGPTAGWIWGSLLFGGAHALNALALPAEERRAYLLVGVPVITAVGGYLGLTYQWSDYSLAPPVAVHFWYDLLLSATFFALDPQRSELSAGITLPMAW